jgi:hypothetical protein
MYLTHRRVGNKKQNGLIESFGQRLFGINTASSHDLCRTTTLHMY